MQNCTITEQDGKRALNYIVTGTLPPDLSPTATRTFKARWADAVVKWRSDRQFEIYVKGRQVIPEEQITRVLHQQWLNPAVGGVGRDRFYEKMSAMFYGVTKQHVVTFLNNLESYQLHKRVIRAETVNPVVPKGPLQYYQIDLIDMSKYTWENNGYAWIMTIIDCFTKKAYAAPLKNKEAETVAVALTRWLDSLPQLPKVIQSDRGSEFISGQFQGILLGKNIKQQLSLAHTPESQANIERFNGTLKRMLQSYFTTYGQNVWVDLLTKVIQNYNSSTHATIGMAPNVAVHHTPTVKKRIEARAAEKVAEAPKYPPLDRGDTVRLSLQTTTDYRKDTFRKKYLTQWTTELYRVVAVIPPASPLTSGKYAVVNQDNLPTGRHYFRHQLQKIDPAALIKNETHRPSFQEGFFNRVQHAKSLHLYPRREYTLPKQTLVGEFAAPERARRNAAPPSRNREFLAH